MATEVAVKSESLAAPQPAQSPPSPSNVPLPTPKSGAPSSAGEQTPSPSTPSSNAQSSASRRPPRKSTLTQQQKNQKRQRATQDQLTTLEIEFNKNPTPTAPVRERIAEEINMTERSVQIWFQNRRAKIKLMAKKSLETGEDIDQIPESMKQYLAMQAMEHGKGLGGFFGRSMMPFGHQGLLGPDQGGQGKVLIHHLSCRSLSIGKWMRVGQNAMDLIIFYSPDKCTMTYYINNDQAGYKIEYPFAYIKQIYLNTGEGDLAGGITIELLNPPYFMMDSPAAGSGFFQVSDFTEDQQASTVLTHVLGGNPKVLSSQLAKLVSLDSYQNRHNPHPLFEPVPQHLSMSAPVSPIPRPSSQPNFAQPHVGMFQESQWGINMPTGAMMMRGPGHKRQRSRSVPGPIDFQTMQMLQNPPSFHITQHHENPGHNNGPHLFAPVPQQPNMLGPMNPNLRIDTQAGFGLDMRAYPMSATTAPSPSGYSTPNFFASQGPEQSGIPAASYTPYSGTFSPLVNPSNLGVPPPSISPLSFNHSDPAIVGESPMSMPAICEGSAISDDGQSISDMYQPTKHTITLPMHPHSPFAEPNQADLELNQFMDLKHFDVDPASLSPESVHQQ
ncbi:hypothetical protein V8F33_011518 [Rhypophila sp. PSN 637]